MNILGINSVYHESAAALVVDGALVAASEEERFNRIKHGKQAQVDDPHQFPEHAIRFCLDYAGLRGCDAPQTTASTATTTMKITLRNSAQVQLSGLRSSGRMAAMRDLRLISFMGGGL
jgi:predicted NodU family carbamoyl transferase